MKKVYIQPIANSYIMAFKNVVLSTSGLQKGDDLTSGTYQGDAKNGMTPVSEDNANSIWED